VRGAGACDAPGPELRAANLLGGLVPIGTSIGSNPAGKISAIVAGMVTGADSIDDLDVIRHGGMPALFGQCYAPSTLGSFLREFTFGHVRQLGDAAQKFLINLARETPLLPGAEAVTYVDVDPLLRRVYGKAKQGRRVRAHQGRRVRRAAARRVRRFGPAAQPAWSPRRSRPPGRWMRRDWCCCARTPLTTRARLVSVARPAGARFSITVPSNRGDRLITHALNNGMIMANSNLKSTKK